MKRAQVLCERKRKTNVKEFKFLEKLDSVTEAKKLIDLIDLIDMIDISTLFFALLIWKFCSRID